MVVLVVRFKSDLSEEQVLQISEERKPQYLAQEGLRQKYYLKFAPNEFGAVYLWDSEDAMKAFRESELARSIPDAYRIQGEPRFDVGALILTLRS
jgi:heme-degrading monooxygenase HmoA